MSAVPEPKGTLETENRDLRAAIAALRDALEQSQDRLETARTEAAVAVNAELAQMKSTIAALRGELEREHALRDETLRDVQRARQTEIQQR